VDAIKLAEYLFKTLRQRQNNIVDSLSAGNVQSMEDYKFYMGELSALRSLEQDLKETLQMDNIDE
jgi:hypothetical protein|tara:strand:+ start:281 stop:475 length:195 start_codon:yes stop_codon:yes gene_type:complete